MDRTPAKISLQRRADGGLSMCPKMEVYLKGKKKKKKPTLAGLYLQHLDISEEHMIYSVCSQVGVRIYNHFLDVTKAHIKKDHFFFLLFDLGPRFSTINV